MTAKVDPNSGNIMEYHNSCQKAFGVKHSLETPQHKIG